MAHRYIKNFEHWIKNSNIQGEYYVPVRPNRGCFEAVIEVILKI